MPDSWFDEPPGVVTPPPRTILSISQLNAQARMLLERGLGSVWLGSCIRMEAGEPHSSRRLP